MRLTGVGVVALVLAVAPLGAQVRADPGVVIGNRIAVRVNVTLADEGATTLLTYAVHAEVGGKLAQLGSRLIDSTSKKLAAQFFTDLGTRLNGGAA